MKILTLNKSYKLGFEPQDKRVRLVIIKDGSEYVCRKESIKKLEQFIDSAQNRIFKGSLQLNKKIPGINVEVRGEVVGSVGSKNFKKALREIKS